MIDAVQRIAPGRDLGAVRFAPEARMQAIMDGVARGTRSERAARLGFTSSASIDEIVADYFATLK